MATENRRVVVYLTKENEEYIMGDCNSLGIPVSARINYIIAEYKKMVDQICDYATDGRPVVFELKFDPKIKNIEDKSE